MPSRIDRAHVRGGQGREEGDRALLQFDIDLAARCRLQDRPQGHNRNCGERCQAGQGAGGCGPGHGLPVRIFARELHRHRARFRARHLRGGQGRHQADGVEAAHSQPAGDGRDGDAQHLRRPVRVVRAAHIRPLERDPVGASAQRPRHRGRGGGTCADGGRRAGRGHLVRQWRAHRQRRHRHHGSEPVHARGRA